MLVTHYRFDETTGLTAADSSDNTYTGTLNNFTSPTDWVSGEINNALSWSAGNSYVAVPPAVLDNKGSFSIVMWIKDSSTGNRTLWSAGNSDEDEVTRCYIATSQTVVVYRDGASNNFGSLGATLRDGSWHSIAYTLDYNTNEAKFYMDGVLQATQTHNNSVRSRIDVDGFNLGAKFSGMDSSTQFQGDMDDFAVYDGVLTLTEIESINRLGVARPLSRMAIVGDIQALTGTQKGNLGTYFADNWEADRLAAVAFVGDLANTPNSTEFGDVTSMVQAIKDSGCKVIATLGNHDLENITGTVRDTDLAEIHMPPGLFSESSTYRASAGTTGIDQYCQSHVIDFHDRQEQWITMPWCPTPDQWSFAQSEAASRSMDVVQFHHAWLAANNGELFNTGIGNHPESVSPNYTIPAENPRKNQGTSGNGQWEDDSKPITNTIATYSGHFIGPTEGGQLVGYNNSGGHVLHQGVNDQDGASGGEGYTSFVEKDGNEWRGRAVKVLSDVVQTDTGDQFLVTAQDSPLAIYKLDERSGTTAKDSSGAGNDATLTNFTVPDDWVGGIRGGALNFDTGVSQQVEVPIAVLEGADDWSLSLWIKAGATTPAFARLISGDNTALANNIVLETSSAAALVVRYRNQSVTYSGLTGLRDGTWRHVGVTFLAATNTAELWYNGASEGTQVIAGNTGETLTFDDNGLYIGNHADGPTADRSWYGLIDEVVIARHKISDALMQAYARKPLNEPTEDVKDAAQSDALQPAG